MTFADADDLASWLDESFDSEHESSANLHLDIASANVRNYTGEEITQVTDATFTVHAKGQMAVRLPHAPAIPVDVKSVEVDGETLDADDYRVIRHNTIERKDRRLWFGEVEITYDYGFEDGNIPDDIRGYVLAEAADRMGNPKGLTNVRLGDFQAGWSGNRLDATANRRLILDRYKKVP